MKRWSRRHFLSSSAGMAVAFAVAPAGGGCAGDGAEGDGLADATPSDAGNGDTADASALDASRDDGLPRYEYDGELGPETTFEHGVASGDPWVDAVVLWSRVSHAMGDVDVFYEVAVDREFTQRVAAGSVQTNEEADYTVKVDVRELNAGRDYYYRFRFAGRTSIVGHARLAPRPGDGTEAVKIVVASCSHWRHGEFFGYRDIAAEEDVDLVVHLGDYVYATSGSGDYRPYPGELERAFDYQRQSYRDVWSLYRRDAYSVAAHAAHTWAVIWDDGDLNNGVWREGPDRDVPFEELIDVAVETFFLWTPIREEGEHRVWRNLPYGDLADITLLDVAYYDKDEPIKETLDGDPIPQDRPERLAAYEPLDFPGRSNIGEEQSAWLEQTLRSSNARWRVVCSGVPTFHWYENESSSAWRGYPQSQVWLHELFGSLPERNVVVYSGGLHKAMAGNLAVDPFAEGYSAADNVGVEITAPSLTRGDGAGPLGANNIIDDERTVRTLTLNPHMRYRKGNLMGYLVCTYTAEEMRTHWVLYDDVTVAEGEEVREVYGALVCANGVPDWELA